MVFHSFLLTSYGIQVITGSENFTSKRHLLQVLTWLLAFTILVTRTADRKVLARRPPAVLWTPIFGRNTRKIHLISHTFTGKREFWTASFQCLAKSLADRLDSTMDQELWMGPGQHATVVASNFC